MTKGEAISTLCANVIVACERAKFDTATCNLVEDALDMAIEALSADRTGKWIYCEDEDEECVDGYRCDQCGFFAPWDYEHKSPYFIEEYLYCPSCKARMKGGDSDD